jgi:hypothetical protein
MQFIQNLYATHIGWASLDLAKKVDAKVVIIADITEPENCRERWRGKRK